MNIVYCQMFFFLLTSDSLNSDSVKKATCWTLPLPFVPGRELFHAQNNFSHTILINHFFSSRLRQQINRLQAYFAGEELDEAQFTSIYMYIYTINITYTVWHIRFDSRNEKRQRQRQFRGMYKSAFAVRFKIIHTLNDSITNNRGNNNNNNNIYYNNKNVSQLEDNIHTHTYTNIDTRVDNTTTVMSVDTYAPSSALSFLDMDDNELLRGADTQPTQYDYRDFTMPSTSQSQTQGDQLELQVSKLSGIHGPCQVPGAGHVCRQLSHYLAFFNGCFCFHFRFVFVYLFAILSHAALASKATIYIHA